MNKKNSIVVVVIFAFLVSFLTLGNWGEPISKLEKTTENITQLDNFETLLGTTWENNKEDPSSAEISFYVDGLRDTKGFFEDFEILFKVSENSPEDAKIKVSIDVSSINTDNSTRDKALMESDFFYTEKFPLIEFYSKNLKKNENEFIANGLLNMMGKRNQLSFNFKHSGITKNKKGIKVAIFEGELEIDRTDFGMDPVTSVGNIVKINFYCELIEKLK